MPLRVCAFCVGHEPVHDSLHVTYRLLAPGTEPSRGPQPIIYICSLEIGDVREAPEETPFLQGMVVQIPKVCPRPWCIEFMYLAPAAIQAAESLITCKLRFSANPAINDQAREEANALPEIWRNSRRIYEDAVSCCAGLTAKRDAQTTARMSCLMRAPQ